MTKNPKEKKSKYLIPILFSLAEFNSEAIHNKEIPVPKNKTEIIKYIFQGKSKKEELYRIKCVKCGRFNERKVSSWEEILNQLNKKSKGKFERLPDRRCSYCRRSLILTKIIYSKTKSGYTNKDTNKTISTNKKSKSIERKLRIDYSKIKKNDVPRVVIKREISNLKGIFDNFIKIGFIDKVENNNGWYLRSDILVKDILKEISNKFNNSSIHTNTDNLALSKIVNKVIRNSLVFMKEHFEKGYPFSHIKSYEDLIAKYPKTSWKQEALQRLERVNFQIKTKTTMADQ